MTAQEAAEATIKAMRDALGDITDEGDELSIPCNDWLVGALMGLIAGMMLASWLWHGTRAFLKIWMPR